MTFPLFHAVSELLLVTHVFNVCPETFVFPPKKREAEATCMYAAGKHFCRFHLKRKNQTGQMARLLKVLSFVVVSTDFRQTSIYLVYFTHLGQELH